MILSVSEYQKKYHPAYSNRTVRRRLSNGMLPMGHIPVKLPSGDWVVEIQEVPKQWANMEISLKPKVFDI